VLVVARFMLGGSKMQSRPNLAQRSQGAGPPEHFICLLSVLTNSRRFIFWVPLRKRTFCWRQREHAWTERLGAALTAAMIRALLEWIQQRMLSCPEARMRPKGRRTACPGCCWGWMGDVRGRILNPPTETHKLDRPRSSAGRAWLAHSVTGSRSARNLICQGLRI
jgi:hypothetical protein